MLQIRIQEELQKMTTILQTNVILKTENSLSKLEIFAKSKKKNPIAIRVFDYENKEKYLIYVSKKYFEEKHVDLLYIGEEGKKHYILIKDFNTFMLDHTLYCTVEENIFVVIVYKLLLQKKY